MQAHRIITNRLDAEPFADGPAGHSSSSKLLGDDDTITFTLHNNHVQVDLTEAGDGLTGLAKAGRMVLPEVKGVRIS